MKLPLVIIFFFSTISTHALDWPQLQANPQRTGYTTEELPTPLTRAWAHAFSPQRLHPQTQPIIANGQLFIGTEMATFYAFDAKTGKINWTQKLGGPILHTAGFEAGRVFVPCANGSIYALDAQDGSLIWSFDSGLRTGFSTAVLLADGKVFAANRGGVYFALLQKDGRPAWSTDIAAPLLMSSAMSDGRLYFGAMDMRVYALNTTDGKIAWKSEPLAGSSFRDYWPVAYKNYLLIRPARASGASYGKAIEWQKGPLPQDELDKQQARIEQAEKDPTQKNLYVLDSATGKEAFTVPQWVTNTMNGATTPPCLDGDNLLIIPVTLHDWRGGWGRLDLEKRRVVEVLSDGDMEYFAKRKTMRGTGNPDENLSVSAAGRSVLTLHRQESNAHYTGAWHLDRRDWTDIPPIRIDQSFSSNTQGGGASPGIVANGMLFHTSENTLNARSAKEAK